MDLTQPGTVGKLYVDNRIEVFLLRDKEENGLHDPDPVVYSCTPSSVEMLPIITEMQIKAMKTDRECYIQFDRFKVFDNRTIAWKRVTVFEGAFQGTTVTFSGPFLIAE